MAYEKRDNSGVLFKEREKKNPKGPDYSGEVMVAGTLYRLAAWIKDGKKGKFMSLALQPATERPSAPKDDLDRDIPF